MEFAVGVEVGEGGFRQGVADGDCGGDFGGFEAEAVAEGGGWAEGGGVGGGGGDSAESGGGREVGGDEWWWWCGGCHCCRCVCV